LTSKDERNREYKGYLNEETILCLLDEIQADFVAASCLEKTTSLSGGCGDWQERRTLMRNSLFTIIFAVVLWGVGFCVYTDAAEVSALQEGEPNGCDGRVNVPAIASGGAVEQVKWSQPPIEIDPTLRCVCYCGWDEPSFRYWVDPLWYEAWNCRTQCHGDADCNGYVGQEDLDIYNSPWGYDARADFTRDGSVTIADLFVLKDNSETYPPADCALRAETSQVVADDFRCLGTIPITSVHWWGSYLGWEALEPPGPEPISWRIGFWSNVADPNPGDPGTFSYPNELLWHIEVPSGRVQEGAAGVDLHPSSQYEDTCFRYYVDLEPQEYFRQSEFETQDDVFWVSIAASYPVGAGILHPWGWKTRPWSWMDDAVTFPVNVQPEPGLILEPAAINPLADPCTGESVDVSFALDTDSNYIKWEQPFTGIRQWPHYEDVLSTGVGPPATETEWEQSPDPNGWDVCVDGEQTHGHDWRHADNWLCTKDGPVRSVRVWYSWDDDNVGSIRWIWVRFHSNDPCGPGGRSEPDNVLWGRRFFAGEYRLEHYGEGEQGWLEPGGAWNRPDHNNFYMLTIEDIADPFIQKEGQIYWLSIETSVRPKHMGLKTAAEQWGDSAVYFDEDLSLWRDLHDPNSGEPMDLAFSVIVNKEYDLRGLVADDWLSETYRPITAAAWDGSYIGYTYQPCTDQVPSRPAKPDYFHLIIWNNSPDDPCNPAWYNYLGDIVWEHRAHDYDEVLVGYDRWPEGQIEGPREPVFRYSVKLPREAWFFPSANQQTYWFGVVAVYDQNEPDYNWGWTNHEHTYGDNAIAGAWVEDPCGPIWQWRELHDQNSAGVDMSFTLFTDPDPHIGTCWDLNECAGQPFGDSSCDSVPSLADLFMLKATFGLNAPWAGSDCCADSNRDGSVNLADLFILKRFFGTNPYLPSTGNQYCP
jgi:hypothetical protein